jgi:dTMP kinase
MENKQNLFIAIEGIDGSGKSTQVAALKEFLINKNIKTMATFEPTNGPIGKMIRQIFAHKMEADHRTIAALFVADRLEHLLNKEDGVCKMLEQGNLVITDRYYFSSYAYHGTHMDMDWVIDANSLCADILRPHLTIYIDMDPAVSMQRLAANRQHIEMYETLDNLKQVKAKYEEAFEKQKGKENVVRVNGNRPANEVTEDILRIVSDLLVL